MRDRLSGMELTPEARAVWDRIPPDDQAALLAHGFCTRCLEDGPFTLDRGEMRGAELALIGKCAACGARVVRLVAASA
jgi:hypothetical protein